MHRLPVNLIRFVLDRPRLTRKHQPEREESISPGAIPIVFAVAGAAEAKRPIHQEKRCRPACIDFGHAPKF